MLKRKVCLVLAIIMTATMSMACNSSSSPKTTPTESVKDTSSDSSKSADNTESGAKELLIGYPSSATYNEVMSAMHENRASIVKANGGKLVTELFEFNDATTVSAVEQLITDGCSAITVTPFSDDVLYKVTDLCNEAGVYFILSMRTIMNDEVRAYVETSDYFLGEVYEDEYSCGYELGKALAETGVKNYCLLTVAADNTTGQKREQGLADAAAEFGLTCLDTYRNPTDATEAQSAVESWISKYGDEMEGLIRLASNAAGDTTAICAKLAENADKDIKFVSADFEAACKEYLESGVMYACGDTGLILDSIAAVTVATRAAIGNPISDEPVTITIGFQMIRTAEEVDAYFNYVAVDDPIFTEDEILNTIMPLSTEELQAYLGTLTPAKIQELKKSR